MVCVRAAFCLALIPTLIAAPQDRSQLAPDVRKLLRKPRQGLAKVTRLDGSTTEGMVRRVTDQFAVVEHGTSCQNIPLASIAQIAWQPTMKPPVERVGSILLWPLYLLVLCGAEDSYDDGPMSGIWESVHGLPNGSFRRIWIHGGGVYRRDVFNRKGRYRIDGESLILSFEDLKVGPPAESSIEETVQIRFQCANLILHDSRIPRVLTPDPAILRRADSPVVGRWNNYSPTEQQAWEFREDGTLQKEASSPAETGFLQKTETGLHIQFKTANGPGPGYQEDWKIRTASDHLWITRNGETAGYKNVPNF